MKFSIGDKIILKRTGEEGAVISYINKEMVEVVVNGTHFPVYLDEIDHPYLKWFTEKKTKTVRSAPEQLPVEKEKLRKPKLAKGVYLSFLPVYKADVFEDVVETVKVYLLNELPQAVYFKYIANNNQQQQIFKHEGKLHGFGHLYLHSISFEEMSMQPRFHWELTDSDNTLNDVCEGIVKIRPQKLFEHISELQLKNEPMFSYLLTDGFAIKADKDVFDTPKPVAKHNKPTRLQPAQDWRAKLPRYEIDLHIEQLVPSIQGLSNADMLRIQLQALEEHLQHVISIKQERTVIIHGLGKGVLRDEVHKVLKQTPEVYIYTNEWNGNYGFGATEVWFRY
jgi:hypothetical protein